ncbi:MAG: hypothetical protein WBI82_13705 [Sphaerochaeta sp.]
MFRQEEKMLFEVVPDGNIHKDVQRLKELANVAGLLVDLKVKEGSTFLQIRYGDEYTEYLRSRNAGRPRKTDEVQLTCGEVSLLKETEGAQGAADRLRMSLPTSYRRYNENKGKKDVEPFV